VQGWTLQELIAPPNLIFPDKGWNLRGTKLDLDAEIEEITRIDQWILNGSNPLSSIFQAKRISWAAGRETTRIEDSAYCIFDVNMHM
jgi:hypothetical protein